MCLGRLGHSAALAGPISSTTHFTCCGKTLILPFLQRAENCVGERAAAESSANISMRQEVDRAANREFRKQLSRKAASALRSSMTAIIPSGGGVGNGGGFAVVEGF